MNAEPPLYQILEVSGAAAATFLQGQVTCDVLQLKENQTQLGACCDHKGRVLANFWVWHCNEKYYLLLPNNILESTRKHLQKYAVFSKVKLANAKNLTQWSVIEYLGPDPLSQYSEKASSWVIASLPLLTQSPAAKDQPTHKFYWIISNLNDLAVIASKPQPSPWLVMQTGLAWIHPKTRGLFTPQMIALDVLGGIHFKKGCYIGQEVIARTHYLGKLKRHLYQIHLPSPINQPPSIGEELRGPQHEIVGILTAVAAHPDGGYGALAVIQDAVTTSELFYLDQPCHLEKRITHE